MLQRELQKTRVHSALAKKLVAAVRFLEPKMKESVAISLVDNLNVLAPVFPNVMILLKDIWPELSDAVQTNIAASLRNLIESGSFLMQIELNLSYVLRVLSANHDGDTEELLDSDLLSRDQQFN